MIIDDFYFVWPIFPPDKTYAILVVNPNTVLTYPIAFEGFQTVARWDAQFIQRFNRIKLV